jgi:hypothetical protein
MVTRQVSACTPLQYHRGSAARPFGPSGRKQLIMATIRERKKRGEEIVKKYKPSNLNDPYACAVDAIADILLYVADNQTEGRKILHSAEIDFRNSAEGEAFLTEG